MNKRPKIAIQQLQKDSLRVFLHCGLDSQPYYLVLYYGMARLQEVI